MLTGAQRSEESLYGSRIEILRLRLRMTVHVFNRAYLLLMIESELSHLYVRVNVRDFPTIPCKKTRRQKGKTTGSRHKIQDRQLMAGGRFRIDGRAIWVYNRHDQKAQTVITLFIRKVYYERIEARI